MVERAQPAEFPCRCAPRRARSLRDVGAAASIAVAAVLVGCASLPDASPAARADIAAAAAAVPSAWQAPLPAGADAAPAAVAAWWKRFDDALLADLVRRAVVDGTDVRTAQAQLRQARALRDQAAAAVSPTLSGSAQAQAAQRDDAPRTHGVGVAIDARWDPDVWGGTRAGVDAAAATEDAQRAAVGATRIAVAAEVAATYVDLRANQARLAIARANLDSQAQTLQIAQWRQQAGLVTSLDVAQARASVEQTRAQLPALQAAIAQGAHALAVLTGQSPAALNAMLAATAAPLPSPPATLAVGIPADVLRRRPDVVAAERRLAAAAARVAQADAAQRPALNLSGSIGLDALNVAALTRSGAGFASLLVGLALPIVDGGRLAAQVDAQQAARDEATSAWRATVLAALQEVEDTLVALVATRDQLAAQQAAAAAARTAADLADQSYRSGLVDFQNVLQTQRTRLAADDAVATTAAAVVTQHVRLYKALGGGWEPTDDANEPTTR